jgi:hypothetical protein
LHDTPVFAKAGAIVPLGPKVGWGGIDAPAELSVTVFPGADNRFDLYEDDGETVAYQQGQYALTSISQEWRRDRLLLKIGPVEGDRSVVPALRTYTLIFRGIHKPSHVEVCIDGAERAVSLEYDAVSDTLRLGAIPLEATSELAVTLTAISGELMSRRDRRLATCRKMLLAFRLETNIKSRIDAELPEIMREARLLARYGAGLKDAHITALTHVIRRVSTTGLENEAV